MNVPIFGLYLKIVLVLYAPLSRWSIWVFPSPPAPLPLREGSLGSQRYLG